MTDELNVLKKLLVEEKDLMKEMEKLVEESSKHFKIEKPSGKIIFMDFGNLSDKQRISIVLLGKYFANKLQLIEDSSLSISEVANELGRPVTALSGPMKELVSKGYVEYLAGRKYRVVYHRISEILGDVLSTKGKKQNG